jgi:hypothetical protein
MSRSIKERLEAGEKVTLSKEDLAESLEAVKTVSLHIKLRQLHKSGVIEQTPGGNLVGGKAWTYQGRRLKVVSRFRGKPKWNHGLDEEFSFSEPHDLAVDTETNMIVASARSS